MDAPTLLADLRARGVTLTVNARGRLVVTPPEAPTAEERTALHTHRDELLELAALADDERCSVCPRPLEVFDPTGAPFCEVHCPPEERWQLTHADRIVKAYEESRRRGRTERTQAAEPDRDDNRCGRCGSYPVFYVLDGWRLCEPCGEKHASRTVVDRLDATPIPTCRICRNDRGAHVGDDGLCACCRAYTRRLDDPHDLATPTREEAR